MGKAAAGTQKLRALFSMHVEGGAGASVARRWKPLGQRGQPYMVVAIHGRRSPPLSACRKPLGQRARPGRPAPALRLRRSSRPPFSRCLCTCRSS
jgi:hypothetical protein